VRGRASLALVIAGVVAPASARAGNGGHPRTPVIWPDDVACMTVVDRSQSAVLQFDYAIPYEDTELTPDELPTSRRHQFVAFCRAGGPQSPPPVWLSWADVEAWLSWAAAHELEAEAVGDEDVLETSSAYQGCFFRITGDDERRPITFEAATQPVVWDTSALPPGAYVIDGYTWEPALNRWSRRPGVVHVVDGPDLAEVGPAAALTNAADGFVFAGDSYLLEGCARALPGSTLTGYWALADTLDWQEFAREPLTGAAIALAFTPPPGLAPASVALRVDVTDPLGRAYSAYPVGPVLVLEEAEATGDSAAGTSGDAEGGAGSSGEGSGATGDTDASGASSSGGGSATAASGEPGPAGCGCRGADAPTWLAWGVLLARRRRGRP
jgi:hypothetical protein